MALTEKRVVIGLSGGVDSAVGAALLKEQGYEVIGVTFKLLPEDWYPGADKARIELVKRISDVLGIDSIVVNAETDFLKEVIIPFLRAYHKGITPNPCALCNPRIKFYKLLEVAEEKSASWIATGHYARVVNGKGRFLLCKSVDSRRDQSYFLFGLNQVQLSRTIFPLGNISKEEVRCLAERLGLPNAGRKDSMDICFVPNGNYKTLIKEHPLEPIRGGEIVEVSGKVLGQHKGIEFYTIGQRSGLGIAIGKPVYVVDLDPIERRVIVGPESALYSDSFLVTDCNWIAFEIPPEKFRAVVKIRYNHTGVEAIVQPIDPTTVFVKPSQPQRAITPGQAAVFYNEEIVLGGGWIARRKN
jgi:tRNA-specific 2-thiouridylase